MLLLNKFSKIFIHSSILVVVLSVFFLVSCQDTPVTDDNQEYDYPIQGFWGSLWDGITAVATAAYADAKGAATGAGVAKSMGANKDITIGTAVVVGVASTIEAVDKMLDEGGESSIVKPSSPHNSAGNQNDSCGLMHNEIIINVFQNTANYTNQDSSWNYTKIYHYSLSYLQTCGYDSTGIKNVYSLNDYLDFVNNQPFPSLENFYNDIENDTYLSSTGKDFFEGYKDELDLATTISDLQTIANGYYSNVESLSVSSDEKEVLKSAMSIAKYSNALWSEFNGLSN